MTSAPPTLSVETRLLQSGIVTLGAVDEVGRGAPAGPATCGIVVIDADVGPAPDGLRDSKLLSAASREALAPRIEEWARQFAVGHATAAEVDQLGLTAALRLAGHRALARLAETIDWILLDGSFDWISQPEQASLLGITAVTGVHVPPVTTKVKADLTCASVAAASVLAKVARDATMKELAREFPGYGWESNKGYGSSTHFDAMRRLGLTPHHRASWRIPGAPSAS